MFEPDSLLGKPAVAPELELDSLLGKPAVAPEPELDPLLDKPAVAPELDSLLGKPAVAHRNEAMSNEYSSGCKLRRDSQATGVSGRISPTLVFAPLGRETCLA